MRSNHNQQPDTRYSELSNYLSKCYNKMADYNMQLKDDSLRNTDDTKSWLSYWEDEYWLTLEELERINPSQNSDNN